MRDLTGKTMFISGGSRGIGLAIAIRAARDGANVALMAKTADPHATLPGTVYTAAAEVEEAGGRALPIVGDIRDERQVADAVARTVEAFGGIDICVNNASALDLSNVAQLSIKRYDLMQSVNARGTFVVSKACLPHLTEGTNPHILTLSPPINLAPHWFGPHAAYTLSKYGMSVLTLGLSEELASSGVAANCLWPRTYIATAAVKHLLGGEEALTRSRRPEIVADAAHVILTSDARVNSGHCYLDEEVLRDAGLTDFSQYAYREGARLQVDLFIDP